MHVLLLGTFKQKCPIYRIGLDMSHCPMTWMLRGPQRFVSRGNVPRAHGYSFPNGRRYRTKFLFRFSYCITFVCLWQILFNHELAKIKRFVSRFTVVELVFIFIYI